VLVHLRALELDLVVKVPKLWMVRLDKTKTSAMTKAAALPKLRMARLEMTKEVAPAWTAALTQGRLEKAKAKALVNDESASSLYIAEDGEFLFV
jgi:hypothetical protein